LGIIISVLFFFTQSDFYHSNEFFPDFDPGAYLGLISVVLAIYFAFENYKFIDNSKKESDEINKKMETNIKEVETQSKNNFEKIENVIMMIKTRLMAQYARIRMGNVIS
jgi:uncharacterized membrane protein (DUF106 family)